MCVKVIVLMLLYSTDYTTRQGGGGVCACVHWYASSFCRFWHSVKDLKNIATASQLPSMPP